MALCLHLQNINEVDVTIIGDITYLLVRLYGANNYSLLTCINTVHTNPIVMNLVALGNEIRSVLWNTFLLVTPQHKSILSQVCENELATAGYRMNYPGHFNTHIHSCSILIVHELRVITQDIRVVRRVIIDLQVF